MTDADQDIASAGAKVESALVIGAAIAMAVTVLVMLLGAEQLVGPDIDDGWYFWKAWHLRMDGALDDPLFGGFGATLFGRVWIEILATAYQLMSWEQTAGHVLPTLCVFAAAVIWYRLGRDLGLSPSQRAILAVLLVVLLPFTRAGLTARPEAFVWLVTSLAVLLASQRRFLLAGLAAGLAIETHQMGAVSLAYLAAWILRVRWSTGTKATSLGSRRELLHLAAGLVAAAALYALLHAGPILATASKDMGTKLETFLSWQTPILAYFRFGSNIMGRLMIGAVCLFALTIYVFERGWRREPLPIFIAIGVFAVYLLVPRANPFYFVYILPAFVLILVSIPPSPVVRGGVFAAILMSSWIGCAVAIYEGRKYSHVAMERRISSVLGETALPVLIASHYFPMVRCRSNLVAAKDLPKVLKDGGPFYLIVPSSYPKERLIRMPESAHRLEIDMGRRATAIVIRVGPDSQRRMPAPDGRPCGVNP